jgi:formylmethanofuran dehydrogenase subunit E
MRHTRKTIWQKLEYLKSIFTGFSIRHIRYCTFSSLHLIVNDSPKWAYIVYDPGTVVSSEMSVEAVDYQRAIERFEDVLAEIDIESEPLESRQYQKAAPRTQSKDENFYEFLKDFSYRDVRYH